MSANDFVQHGQELVDSGQYQQAVKVCRLGLLAHPTAIAGRLVLGTALMLLRRYDEVLAEMRVALEIDAQNPRAMALKGEALMHKGDPGQAAQVLYQARAFAPDDKRLAKLCRDAEVLLATVGPNDYAPSIGDMTKNYPVHLSTGGREDSEGSGGAHITLPRGAVAQRPSASALPTPQPTMDLDPMDSAVELLPEISAHDDAGDSMEMTRALDTGGAPPAGWDPDFDSEDALLEELDQADLASTGVRRKDPAPAIGRGKAGLHAPRGGFDETAHYRKAPEAGAASAAPPGPRDPGPPFERRAPVLPLSAPPTGIPRAPSAVMPPLDSLFPETDDGVSKILLTPEAMSPAPRRPGPFMPAPVPAAPVPPAPVPPAPMADAVKQVRAPNQPTLAISPVQVEEQKRLGHDMQRLRQDAQRPGVAEDPDGLLLSMVEMDGEFSRAMAAKDATIAPGAPMGPMGAPPPPAPPPMAPPVQPAPVEYAGPAPRKRSVFAYLLYAIIGLGVVAGGVFAGFKIREIRLERQIRNTQRDAKEYARQDTYAGYARARAAHGRIVSVRADDESRSALARAQAALAAEFGEGQDEAATLVAELGEVDNLDALVARTYLAQIQGEGERARTLGADLEKRFPDEFMGPYLAGKNDLFAGDADAAVKDFERALRLDRRPIGYIGLGRAQLARGAFDEAEDAFREVVERFPDHPEANIGLAWVIIRSRVLADDLDKRIAALRQVGEDAGDDAETSTRQRAQALMAVAALELAAERGDDAKKTLRQVLEIMPLSDPALSVELMRALSSAGDGDAAAKEAERAFAKWPEDLDIRVAVAEVALARGEPQRAVDILSVDIAGNARALHTRGQAFLALGIVERAISDLDASLGIAPKSPDVVMARARADRQAGNAEFAAKRLEALYTDDAPLELAVAYAAALREAGKRKEARDVLEKMVQRPRSGLAQLELARLERDDAHFVKAKEAYEKAVAEFPERAEIKLEAVLLRLDTGETKAARASLEALLAEQPKNPRILLESARLYTMTGAYAEAERVLDTAKDLATAPRWQVARERGRLALRKAEPRKAVGLFQSALDADHQDSETWLLLLDAQLAADDIDAARKTTEALYKKFPVRAAVRDMARARLALYDDRLKDALDAYESARKKLKQERATPREMAEVYFWTGRAYFYADKLEEARDAMATAIDNNPGLADAHFWLGLAYLGLIKYSQAETSLREAVTLDPAGIPEAWYYLGESLYNEKRRADAKQAFQDYLDRFPDGSLASDARRYVREIK